MDFRPPLLDDRSFEDILNLLRESASRYAEKWRPGDNTDAGVMLQHTFARLMEIVIERLNRVPEKQKLAFLHAMNISPLPPVPARAPLVFTLKNDAPPTLVPKGTQVVAKSPDGSSPVFETTEDLTVIPASITCAYTMEPDRNRYGDYTNRLSEGVFAPFIGEKPLPEAWFFVIDNELNIEDSLKTSLTISFDRAVATSTMKRFFGIGYAHYSGDSAIEWSYSAAEGELVFTPYYLTNIDNPDPKTELILSIYNNDSKAAILRSSVTLGGGNEPPAGCFIKIAVKNGFENLEAKDKVFIKSARLSVDGNPYAPKHLFFRNSRLDPEAYVLPFGKRPTAGDAFFINMGELPEQPGDISFVVNIIPEVEKKEDAEKVGNTLNWSDLAWSYSTRSGWSPIDKANITSEIETVSSTDTKYTITFKIKQPFTHQVGGEDGHWLRAVLPKNDCGTDAEYITASGGGYTIKPGTGKYVYPKLKSVTVCIRYSTDCRIYRQTGHIYTNLGDSYPTHYNCSELANNAFYLGFDHIYQYKPISLFADVESTSQYSLSPDNNPPKWECLTYKGWTPIFADDNTYGLSRSGAIRLLPPSEPEAAHAALFDNTERYWIRLIHNGGSRLNGIYLNAVPVEQAVTVVREALGTSNGKANLSFSLRGTPVLTDQRIWVREDEAPTSAELAETEMEIRRNPVTLAQENWVLWHEQNSFSVSLPNSRHYTIDRDSGEIRFGDGERGMAPVNGSAIAAEYRFGGGSHGNLPANAIAKLSTKLPDIKSVYNPIPAVGGADSESIPDVLSRGPMALRNRGRGVTALDIEWLVKEAAGSAVDRIKCLPGNEGQPFTLLLLPAEEGLCPLPDGVLSSYIRDYLNRYLPASISGGSFDIVGPRYITVGITATVIPTNPLESNVVQDRVSTCLHTFLHPRLGALSGNGWEFGRNVYLSEICALIESVEGVEHTLVSKTSIYPTAIQRELTLQTNNIRLETAYPAGSLLFRSGIRGVKGEQWLLAEPINTDVLPSSIRVTGLREGDELSVSVTFYYDEYSDEFISYGANLDFPSGSIVYSDGGFSTRLISPIKADEKFTRDMLLDPAPEWFKDQAEITVLHPDTLTVTNVWDESSGDYCAEMRRQSEDLKLYAGMMLECEQRKVKVAIRYEYGYASSIKYQNDLVTVRFGGFVGSRTYSVWYAPSISNAPPELTLNLPDGNNEEVRFLVSSANSVTDTAYLFERELCTPGVINVIISEEL
jgi:uncharacterized phage protein gp47/JayE